MAPVAWFVARSRSFSHAFRGLRRLLSEPNFRVHLAALVLVAALGVWLGLESLEWACIALAVSFVLVSEAFNTALEALADAAVPERNRLVGVAKDVAATAVLISAVGALAVAVCVFFPKLLARLS